MNGSKVDQRMSNGAQMVPRTGSAVGGVLKPEAFSYLCFITGLRYIQSEQLKGGGWIYKDPVNVYYLSIHVLLVLTPIRTSYLRSYVEGRTSFNTVVSSQNTYFKDLADNRYAQSKNTLQAWVLGIEVVYLVSEETISILISAIAMISLFPNPNI